MSPIINNSVSKKYVHVAVAVVNDNNGNILITKRPAAAHQGGLWEFPGGKVEQAETAIQALKRELFEEIGITVILTSPLIRIHYDYDDKSVLLDVWSVDEFTGRAYGKERQEMRWISKEDFSLYDFPVANYSILKVIQLPDKYMITGDFENENELLSRISISLENGIKLIQFRAYNLPEKKYFEYAKKIYDLCIKKKSKLLLNTSVKEYKKFKAEKFSHGLHLSFNELNSFNSDLLSSGLIISASTHNRTELDLAQNYNLDFVVLSPINNTLSHPNTMALGWKKFGELVEMVNIPVYALGGMNEEDIKIAKYYGGQGISAIREFWL